MAAIRYPGLCARLFLIDALGHGSWPPAPLKPLQALRGVVRRLPPPRFKPIVRTWFRRGHDSSAQAKAALEAHWSHYARNGAAALVRQIKALDASDTLAVAAQVPKLNLPVRVVWGTADRFHTDGEAANTARAGDERPKRFS